MSVCNYNEQQRFLVLSEYWDELSYYKIALYGKQSINDGYTARFCTMIHAGPNT